MTAAGSRAKGLVGERQVAGMFEAKRWQVRGLENSGDWLAFLAGHHRRHVIDVPHTLHVEVKRQERLRLPEWIAQAKAEAPSGVPPVVVFRQNRAEWIAALPLADLLELIR